MAAAQARKSQRYKIPGLDGIRGLAVLSLFVFHADILPHFPGALATTVFFFLSGFLITTLFVREFKKTGSVDLGAFYLRRALRILPPLYIVLALALLASFVGHVGDPLASWKVAGHFLQYTNVAMAIPRSLVGFLPGMLLLWSLAVDEHFYLLFAPFFRVASARVSLSRMAHLMLAMCGLILIWRCAVFVHEGSASIRIAVGTDTRMDSILWGAFLALWRNPALEPERAKRLASPLLLTLGFMGLILPMVAHNDVLKGTLLYTIQGVALIPIFSAAILHGRFESSAKKTPVQDALESLAPVSSQGGRTNTRSRSGFRFGRILESKFLLWTSQISYPFYLFSGLALDTMFRFVHLPKLLVVSLTFAIVYGLATFMHLYLERPMMTLRRRKPGISKGTESAHAGAVQLPV